MMHITRRLSPARDDAGFALGLVLGIGLVLMLLVVASTTFAVSSVKSSRNDQDWNAALAAAYAGVDEYQSRLSGDSSYGQFGNPNAPYTIATGSSVVAPPASAINPAFDVTVGGTWGRVVGIDAEFRYEVDNSDFSSNGQLRIRSTGKVGSETRSVVANLKGKGFIDFLYFTDYEIMDPALSTSGVCVPRYAYPNTDNRTNCQEITFGSGDELDGPVHSNDVMHICDATFTGRVTSAYPTSPYYSPRSGRPTTGTNLGASCGGQNFEGGNPEQDSTVTMPVTNDELKRETAINLARDVPRPGCLYTGPTSITLLSNGKMRVKSPWTKYTQLGANGDTPAAGVVLATCGTPGPTGLGSAAGATIDIPNNNIVFVQAVPPTAGDANYWGTATPATVTPTNPGFIGCFGSNTNTNTNPYRSNNTVGQARVAGNGIGYPTSKSVTASGQTRVVNEKPPVSNAYDCKAGDLFVEGTLHGRLTLAAANYVYITDDITYTDPNNAGEDMLGLIGGKAVWIWSPVLDAYSQQQSSSNNNTITYTNAASTHVLPAEDRKVQGAILSVENTFTVQNYNVSPKRGYLYIYGGIAQKYRGIVSQGGGYIKRYSYDERFKITAPPKFLAPVSTTYGVTSYADVPRGFKANGSPAP